MKKYTFLLLKIIFLIEFFFIGQRVFAKKGTKVKVAQESISTDRIDGAKEQTRSVAPSKFEDEKGIMVEDQKE